MCYRYSMMPSRILFVAALGSVMVNSEVKETHSNYSCCEPKIRFNMDCRNTWQINNGPFARSETNECTSPCVSIRDGVMTLDQCVAFNAIVVCTKQNMTAEQRIYYTNETCAGSGVAPGNHGSVGSVLLALLIGGWFVKHIC